MTLVLDTSALLKRYVEEPGRRVVMSEMVRDDQWCASVLAFAEAHIALCRLRLDEPSLARLRGALEADRENFFLIPADEVCLARAAEIGCAEGVRTLDALHLAAAERVPRPCRFLTFDEQQLAASRRLGLDTVDPVDPS